MLAWVKGHVWLSSVGKMAAASLFVATFGITGCGDDPVKAGVAKGCTLNSDCKDGLVCGFGLCHQECEESSDCPAGQRCVQTEKSNVCQLNDEAECHFNSDCAKPLVCAVDLQCRNQCNGKEDCLPSQECADHVCAEPEEVDESGGLKGAVTGAGGEGGGGPGPSGGSGGSGAASTGGTGGSGTGMAGDGAGGEGPPACTPGGDCVLDGMPCQIGVVACDGDTPSCQVLSDADDGTECGTDKVCSEGACVGCALGDACQPDANNPCIAGTVSCAQGPACDTDGNVKNGTGCGTDKVCSAGTCTACVVDEACDPAGQACKNGKRTCSDGPACVVTTSKEAGVECGTDQVCNSGGSCVSCVQDGACSPDANTCHVGIMDCKNGPNCADTGNPAADGLVCDGPNTYDFCKAGVCAQCQNNNPCVPANPCHKGTLNCGTAPPTCNDTQANADDGLVCGDNKSCISGACVTNDRVLTVTSAQPAAVAIDAPFSAVTVKLVDKNGANVQGAKVEVVASAGAYALASANTNASGVATINGRVGRAIGSYTFTATAPGAASTQFTVSAVAPTDKHIFTLVNVNHLNNGFGTPGPGTISQLSSYARGVAAAKDGTLYLSSYCNVYSLSPAGVLAKVAGAGTPTAENCGTSGDSGLGTTLNLYDVRGVALDEDNGFLYIADFNNRRVMQLALADGSMLRFAGDKNAANADPWGDGFPADSAYMQPTSVQVAPNGDLYIGDVASDRMRKVDFNSNIITSAFKSNPSCTAADSALSFRQCYYYAGQGCHVTWDKDGKAFVSATLCGGGVSTSYYGIARVDGPGALTLIAGKSGAASIPEGGVATSASFGTPPAIAFDKAGNLFLAAADDQRVLRIDAVTSKITTIAGNGTAAYAGDYVLGTAAQVSSPANLTFDANNNLYFADSGNRAIRSLWNIGATVAPTATLATTGGTGQTVKIDAPFNPLTVKLTDSNSVNISGVEVKWKRLEDGSGLGSTGAAETSTKTNAAGTASMTGRVGLALGDYKFEASVTDIHGVAVGGSPRTFTVAAEAPTAGHIFPIVNYTHTQGPSGTPGPATFAKLYSQANGVVAASDGTIYVADYAAVYEITPRGEVTVLAGTPGSYGFSGDTGPALGAKLSGARGLALDETRKVLYIADSNNSRIRRVYLDTGVIETLAGGGVNTAPYGDGFPGAEAHIGAVDSVTVGPDGKVYFPDKTHYTIRVVDPDSTTVTRWLNSTYNTGSCQVGTVSLYYPTEHSAIRFAADGSAFISGYICQGVTAGTPYGIMRLASNGTTRIVGLSGGATTDGIDAIATVLPDLGDFILDANEDIVLSTWTDLRVRKINMTTGKINTLAGTGTPVGYESATGTGDYEPASGVKFRYASKLANWPGGHLLIADRDNYTVRMIW